MKKGDAIVFLIVTGMKNVAFKSKNVAMNEIFNSLQHFFCNFCI